MLFVVGLTFLVVGALVTAGAGVIFQNRMGPSTLRWLIGTQAMSAILATFMGSGLMILFLFIVEFEDQTFGTTKAALSVAIVAVGILGLRFLGRRQNVTHTASNPAA